MPADVEPGRGVDRKRGLDEVVTNPERRARMHVDAEDHRVRRRVVRLDDGALRAAAKTGEVDGDGARIFELGNFHVTRDERELALRRRRVGVARDFEVRVGHAAHAVDRRVIHFAALW